MTLNINKEQKQKKCNEADEDNNASHETGLNTIATAATATTITNKDKETHENSNGKNNKKKKNDGNERETSINKEKANDGKSSNNTRTVKPQKIFQLNDVEKQLVACKAEITRTITTLESLVNDKDRTITTLKTRLLLTENKCTTAPIIENNNDEMSTTI